MQGQVRGLPAAPLLPHRPQPGHPVDVLGARRRPPPRRRRRLPEPPTPRPGRPARRGLRGRERPLPDQEGLRRPQLESRAALAADRAGRRRQGRASTCWPSTDATSTPPDNLYARFENTAGKIVEITVGPESRRDGLADGQGRARRRRGGAPQPRLGRGQPHEGREGDGRPGGLRLRARTRRPSGYVYFKRYFFPQADKEAIIVDERFNGGGSVADYYID